jgi:hypothetical protein
VKYFKLAHMQGDEWREHSQPPYFKAQMMGNGSERLVVGVPSGDSIIIRRLAEALEPPYFVLYILHTPRGEGEAARYQSPELDRTQLEEFLIRFSDYLAGDGRFDFWIYSMTDGATLAWDRHNILHAYGPIAEFTSILRGLGFTTGEVNASFEHVHYYRPEFDEDAAEVLGYFSWAASPLKPSDEQ